MARIVHLTSVHNPFDTRIFHRECKAAVDEGYDVRLVAPYRSNENVDGIHIYGISEFKNRFRRMASTVREVYQKALELDGDIYQFHDPELIPVGVALTKVGKRVIYDVHEDVPADIISKEWIPIWLRRVVAILTGKVQRWGTPRFSAIIAATPHITTQFSNLGVPVKTIQNFPGLKELRPRINVRPYHQRSANVVYVGSITKVRGIYELVRAASLLSPELRLVLAGNFDEPGLAESVSREPGWTRIDYRGWLSREAVSGLLAESRIGLVIFQPAPNHMEAQPNKMFEFMAAGLPVIASDFPYWRNIIQKEGCGLLVNPLNPKEIADAICYLVTNPRKAQKMGELGAQAIKRKFHWEKEAEKLLALYQVLLKDGV